MVSLIEDLKNVTTSYFKNENDLIYLLGEDFEEIGGSEYLKIIHGKVAGDCPKINLATESILQNTVLELIEAKLINSAHDISEGGIACALAECCIINREKMIGAEVNIPIKSRVDFSLFSESQYRVLISIDLKNQNSAEDILNKAKQPFILIGKTGSNALIINKKIRISLFNFF